MQIRRTSNLEQLSLLNITEHNQNPWMQILFSSPLNKKELAFQEGSIDAGVSKALAHLCRLMMKVRREAVTEGDYSLFGKVVTMTFSNSFRPAKIWQPAGSTRGKKQSWLYRIFQNLMIEVFYLCQPSPGQCVWCNVSRRIVATRDINSVICLMHRNPQILGHRGSQIHGSGCRTFSTASPDSCKYVAWSVNRQRWW